MNAIFIAVGNNAEHSGFVTQLDRADIWTSDNPGGWTYQDACGSHGTVLGEFDTEAEARSCLREFLVCPAAAVGSYCYTHNPSGR